MSAKTVFISYSHDSDEHSQRVLALSERLREDGVVTQVDQYVNGTPNKGWPRWMLDQLDEAEAVIVVCTETYYRRFRGHESPGKGKGVDWEGALITQEIYDERSDTVKFVPVLFAPDDESFIPEPVRGLTYYLLTSEDNYNGLYDFLLGQAGVEPHAVGTPKIKERRRGEPLRFGEATAALTVGTQIAPSRLHHGADHLFGRDRELADLDKIANDPSKKVLTIVAFGGVGKTSLVIEWMGRKAAKNWENFDRVFDWSFFSQGTREEGAASADVFIGAALRFFGDETMAAGSASAWDKGARLAQLVSQQRTLLVLDGVEPLQHPPGPLAGELKDPALATLLRGLARQNSGLCIVTTREHITDLAAFRDTTAPEWELDHLSIPASVELLKSLGVQGTPVEFDAATREVKGHALTLNLLGRYLAKAHQGDIRKRDQVKFERADAKIQGGYAFKTIGAYEKWLNEGGDDGAGALAVLRLMGLFDRPASVGCLVALRSEPTIEGLSELLVDLNDVDWNLAISSLEECGLVSRTDQLKSSIPKLETALDAHPLIREYFAKQLREKNLNAWRAAHRRLYEYLRDTTSEGDEPTLEDLQPLYEAVAHGCEAGLQQEACREVYYARILRGEEHYAWHRLGAYTSDLGILASLFDTKWSRASSALTETWQIWLFNEAAFCLSSLGRLMEAGDPMRAALEGAVRLADWTNASRYASNLSELQITLGEVTTAVKDTEEFVRYSDRSGDAFVRMVNRANHAIALCQAGREAEAHSYFREAEQIQSEMQPEYPLIYSVGGFNYCELLLMAAERSAWQTLLYDGLQPRNMSRQHLELNACRAVSARASRTLEWVIGNIGPLHEGFDRLSLSRAALYAAVLEQVTKVLLLNQNDEQLCDPITTLNTAVDDLRRAGRLEYVPRGLLTRAWLRTFTDDNEGARIDLDEAWEIAERGPMRLHMADIHLYRARLFHAVKPYPWNKNLDGTERGPKDDLAAARKLIEQCGYWRRKEELEDAEKAAKSW